MNRVYNFSAGPAALPEDVLLTAQRELLNYNNSGMSVMELSHRSSTYEEIIQSAESNLRKLMSIPDSYAVLFLQGGATAQFSAVPLNLMKTHKRAYYIHTGVWSQKAIKEAKRYGEVSVIASSEDKNFSCIPDMKSLRIDDQADYLHITSNNTIEGTRFSSLPKTSIPIVSDMSSMILSEKIDVTDYGLIYAGAQKNIGPAGVAIVIVRKDLMGHEMPITPILYQYKAVSDENSMLNTPPTYAIYVAGLVFKWLLDLGGVEAMESRNRAKAKLLYDFLDQSRTFKSPVNPADRSLMNIPFTSPSEEIDKAFIKKAEAQGFVNLKGHRLVGGMRASIYNAMPEKGVEALVAFMDAFERG